MLSIGFLCCEKENQEELDVNTPSVDLQNYVNASYYSNLLVLIKLPINQ